MRRKKLGIMAITVSLLIGLGSLYTGCKKSESGTGPGGGGGGGGSQFITVDTPFGRFTVPTLGISNLKGLLLTTSQDTSKRATALFFGSTTSQLVYAGDVSVNTNTVDTLTFSGQVIYIRPKPTNPQPLVGVNFDGSSHNWVVAGSSGVPAFNASVVSPNGVPTITSPAANASVPRSQPLTVNWSGSGSDSVLISISDGSGGSLNVVTSGNSHTFSAADMGTLQAGNALIDINRFKVTVVNNGGNTYFVAAATTAEILITLN